MENVLAIKAIPRSFKLASGLKINFAKSYFGAIGVSERRIKVKIGKERIKKKKSENYPIV